MRVRFVLIRVFRGCLKNVTFAFSKSESLLKVKRTHTKAKCSYSQKSCMIEYFLRMNKAVMRVLTHLSYVYNECMEKKKKNV
jgi:hypothetical protein